MNIDKKNILLVHAGADMYGAGKSLLAIARVYQSHRWSTTVLLPYSGPLEQTLRGLEVEVVVCELGVIRRKYLNPFGLINRLLANIKAISTIKKICKEKKIDLVHTNTLSVLSGGIAANSLGIPHLMHVREIIKKDSFQKRILKTYIKKYVNFSIVVSNEVKKSWRLSDSESKVIYNGIDQSQHQLTNGHLKQELGFSNDTIVIGMVARLHYWKGQMYFLKIARELVQSGLDVHFILVGDVYPGYEYLKKELDESISDMGLSEKITDLGYRRDIPNILQSLDVFVLPSILPDPLPNTVLEAMASGKPVVATNHGGAMEMVSDGETGFLIPWDDPKKAGKRVTELIESKEMRVAFGEIGRKRVEELFSIESFNQELVRTVNLIEF